MQGTDTRYQPCEVNPGVGYDTRRYTKDVQAITTMVIIPCNIKSKSSLTDTHQNERRHNFTLLAQENGALKPFGSFLTEDAGIQGQGGMKDKEERGPHGIVGLISTNKKDGVSKKMLHQLNGPPGVQLQPPGHWQNNLGAVNQERVEYNPEARYTNLGFANQNRNANVGDWRTPQNRPASASLLTNRPAAARRQRPSTALLRDKGQWTEAQRQPGGGTRGKADHLLEPTRDYTHLCGALGSDRVEYNPDSAQQRWAGLWEEQKKSVHETPYN